MKSNKDLPKAKKIFDKKMFLNDVIRFLGMPGILAFRPKKIFVNPNHKGLLKGKYIICANHSTYIDPLILMLSIPSRRLCFYVASQFFNNKSTSNFLDRTGQIRLNRDNIGIDSIKQGIDVLERGHILTIFPEGKVSLSGVINKFKSGIVTTALLANCEILPVYINRKTYTLQRQYVVIGDKFDPRKYVKGTIPTQEEINNITNILQSKEEELQRYFDEYWLKKHKNKVVNKVKFNKKYFKQFANKEVFKKIINVNSINKLLVHAKQNYGSLNAVGKFDNTIATYNDLYGDVNDLVGYLKENNITNQNIGLYASNGYDFEKVALAIMASNNTLVPIPTQYDMSMLSDTIKRMDIKHLFVENKLIDKVKGLDINVININEIDTKATQDYINIKRNKKDPAVILLTSGTTGKPKGVILSHYAILGGTINGCYGLSNVFNQIYYCLIPLTHSFGLIRNMLCSIYTESCIFYNQDKMQLFGDLAKYKPTILVIVPALADLFLNLMNSKGKEICGGNLHTVICGSSSVPSYLPNGYKKLDITFCPGYGLTECSNIVSGNPKGPLYSDSVGTIFPDQQAKIVDGELYIKGRTVFSGYYNQPEETQKVLHKGWLKTGDLAKFDINGYLYIIGRIKDLIVLSNGENVSPSYLESKVNQLHLIQDSLVYDKVNEFGNCELICEVYLRPEAVAKLNKSQEELHLLIQQHIDEVNKQLLDYERINKFIIRDKDFERNSAMKIIRKKR